MEVEKHEDLEITNVWILEDIDLRVWDENTEKSTLLTIRGKKSCKSNKPWTHIREGHVDKLTIKKLKTKEVYTLEYPNETIEITKTRTRPSNRFLNRKSAYKCSYATCFDVLDWLNYETELVWDCGEDELTAIDVYSTVPVKKPVFLFLNEEGKLTYSVDCPDKLYVEALNKKSVVKNLR